jgi:ABC-2 type transport system permease protein
MKQFKPILRREFYGYFRSPVGYVFMVIFLLASVGCTFFIGELYESNQANLIPFFTFLPWLYLVLVPAIGMRLWAEERRSGTIELLFTLPVDTFEAVLAKFTAGWGFLMITTALTFPLWITVSYLGDPDHGVIVASYIGSFLMGGAFLAVSSLTSALTKNQVISFILGVIVNFVLVLCGWGVFSGALSAFLPTVLVDAVAALGYMPHFMSITKGVIDSRDVFYFGLVMAAALLLNSAVLDNNKAS